MTPAVLPPAAPRPVRFADSEAERPPALAAGGAAFHTILAALPSVADGAPRPTASSPAPPPADGDDGLSPGAGVDVLSLRAHQGEAEMALEMSHPDLGAVRVFLLAAGGGLSAHLLVPSEDARELVEGQLHHLKQRLEEAGPWNVRVSVSDTGARRRQPDEEKAGRGPRRQAFRVPGRRDGVIRALDIVV